MGDLWELRVIPIIVISSLRVSRVVENIGPAQLNNLVLNHPDRIITRRLMTFELGAGTTVLRVQGRDLERRLSLCERQGALAFAHVGINISW